MKSRNDFETYLASHNQNTARSYITSFERIMKDVDPDFNRDKKYGQSFIYKKYSDVVKKLEGYKLPSQKVVVNGLLKFLEFIEAPDKVKEKYKKLFDIIASKADDSRIYKEASQTEKDNLISYSDLDKLAEEYKGKLTDQFVYNIDIPYLILSLYAKFVPLRQNEWATSIVEDKCIKKKTTRNFVCLNKKEIHVNDYKTVSKYGEKILKLPDELIDIIKLISKKHKSKYLIPNRKLDDHISSSEFTKMFNKATGKKISSSMLRKIYISEKFAQPGFNGVQRKELAKMLSHSPATQALVYARFGSVYNA